MATLSAAQIAQLAKQAGFTGETVITMTAICIAESGGRTDARGGPNRNGTYDYGLWQLNSVHKFDTRRLTAEPAYNAQCAKTIHSRQGLGAWSVYNSGAYKKHLNAARQGAAQSASVVGTVAVGGSTAAPAVTYGPPGPQITIAGVGTPLKAAMETPGPLTGLRIIGTDIQGDFSSVVIGTPHFEAGWETVPHLTFTIVDPQGDLLWKTPVWERGSRVTYMDLDLRMDEIKFAPGGHGTGQLEIVAIDSIVYALQLLRGARTAHGISAVQWAAQELGLAGFNPNQYLLGESVPTQSEIARDVPDQAGQTGSGDVPSAWTTLVRLAGELGKRCFVSGRRLVFGSAGFAMRWASPGDLRVGVHDSPGEQWLGFPTATQTSIGNRSGVVQVQGKVPLNRAYFFRPGVAVMLFNTPGVIGRGGRQFVVSSVSHDLARDTDGAEITLIEPVDKPVGATS